MLDEHAAVQAKKNTHAQRLRELRSDGDNIVAFVANDRAATWTGTASCWLRHGMSSSGQVVALCLWPPGSRRKHKSHLALAPVDIHKTSLSVSSYVCHSRLTRLMPGYNACPLSSLPAALRLPCTATPPRHWNT